MFTTLDRDVIAKSPWQAAWPAVERLAAEGKLVSLQHGGTVLLRDLFRSFLEERLSQAGESAIPRACNVAAALLESCGHIVDALRLYARGGNDSAVLKLCEHYGFALVDEGHLDELQDALSTVKSESAAHSAVALAVKAIAESNANRSDIAESWYLHAIEAAEHGSVLRAEIAYRYGLDLVRQGRLDGIEMLEPYVGSALPVELDASLRSTLATAYVLAQRFDDAHRMIETALALLDGSASKQLQAKVHHHAAWVALLTGQIETARAGATLALEMALDCGMYDVAARAYSVLYNIAYDIEDSPKHALDILDRVLDCGLKAGSEQMRLFALLGSIDIRAEMGDTEGLRAVEKALAAHGIDYAEQGTSEALIPAEALTLAGRGKFALAYDVIFPTGERQATPDRRALRFSEIAFYAAAGGLVTEAEAALHEVKRCLLECDAIGRRTVRTQIYRALAVRQLGRTREASAILDHVNDLSDMMSPRLRALYEGITAIFHRWDGADNYEELYQALRMLRTEDFGGVAAVLEALPCTQEQMQIAG